jgi:leucyl-tRNA synthetase
VLSDYGTGAIMGVPYHDERDCAFALKNNLAMIQVIDGDEQNNLSDCVLANSREYSGLKVPDAVEKIFAKLEKLGTGKKTTEYRIRDWLVSR